MCFINTNRCSYISYAKLLLADQRIRISYERLLPIAIENNHLDTVSLLLRGNTIFPIFLIVDGRCKLYARQSIRTAAMRGLNEISKVLLTDPRIPKLLVFEMACVFGNAEIVSFLINVLFIRLLFIFQVNL